MSRFRHSPFHSPLSSIPSALSPLLLTLSFSLLVILYAGCNTPDYSHYATVDPDGWDPLKSIEFRDVPDSAFFNGCRTHPKNRCDIKLLVRYIPSLADSVVSLHVEFESLTVQPLPAGKTVHAVLPGSPKAVATVSIPLQHSFCPKAPFSIAVSPSSTLPPRGICNVGISVVSE